MFKKIVLSLLIIPLYTLTTPCVDPQVRFLQQLPQFIECRLQKTQNAIAKLFNGPRMMVAKCEDKDTTTNFKPLLVIIDHLNLCGELGAVTAVDIIYRLSGAHLIKEIALALDKALPIGTKLSPTTVKNIIRGFIVLAGKELKESKSIVTNYAGAAALITDELNGAGAALTGPAIAQLTIALTNVFNTSVSALLPLRTLAYNSEKLNRAIEALFKSLLERLA